MYVRLGRLFSQNVGKNIKTLTPSSYIYNTEEKKTYRLKLGMHLIVDLVAVWILHHICVKTK